MKNRTYVSLFLMTFWLSNCRSGESPSAPAAKKGPLAFPVETEVLKPSQVEYAVTAVGSVEAFEVVQVTARVAGVLDKVRFTEGQKVTPQDILAEIEPSRFRLAVAAAQAAFDKATAAQAEARAGLERREAIETERPGLIRGEELEGWRARALTAAAEARAAQVALEQAQLNLKEALVRAPLGGVLQTRSIQTGQYVQPGTVLATVVRRDPLRVRFKVSETEAAQLHVDMPLEFKVPSQETPFQAKIVHVADVAEEVSRRIQVTANVTDDKKALLRAGAFAEIRVPVKSNLAAITVPQTAIRPSEKGFLAFVVKNQKAEERLLTLGMNTANNRVEILTGLIAGEELVIRGGEALKPQANVRVISKEGGPR